MKRALIALVATMSVVLATAGAPSAGSSWHLSGGGTADISQVAFNVRIDGSGNAKGSFQCLMAGRSAFVLPAFGLSRIMSVHAWPTEGAVNGTEVTFSGSGHLIADGDKVPVDVVVWADEATQRFELVIVGLGGPGVEEMTKGRFSLR